MAYSILDEYGDCQKIRVIADRHPHDASVAPVLLDWWPTDTKWVCDPCNKSAERYEVTYPSGCKQFFRWFDIVHHDDSAEEIKLKLDYAMRVKQARFVAEAARREFERLNG